MTTAKPVAAASDQALISLRDARRAMNAAVAALKHTKHPGLVQRAKDVHSYIAIIEGTLQRKVSGYGD
jgi:hypothetical protein